MEPSSRFGEYFVGGDAFYGPGFDFLNTTRDFSLPTGGDLRRSVVVHAFKNLLGQSHARSRRQFQDFLFQRGCGHNAPLFLRGPQLATTYAKKTRAPTPWHGSWYVYFLDNEYFIGA